MNHIKKSFLMLVLCILATAASTHAATKAEVADRGGGGLDNRGLDNRGVDNGYGGGYGGAYGEPVVPAYGYPAGGYLYPGPVDPGEDAADAIYKANQHPGE